jgi:mannose PTS system EIIA component
MIPVVFVGHGDYAAGVRDAAEMILGPQEHVAVVALQPDGSTEGVTADVEAVLDRLGTTGHEALVLADLMGGSPANAVAALALQHDNLQLVSGLNLPMALEVLTSVEETAAALAEVALTAGQGGVLDVAARLRAAAAARK